MLSRLSSGAAALSIAGLVLVGLSPAAFAQEGDPNNPGQGSENCPASGQGPGNAPGNSPNYPPAQGEGVSDDSPARGQQMSASSGCREFAPGQRVAFGVESVFQQLGTVIATADGSVRATFTVPTNLANGPHHVVFRGLGFNGAQNEVRIPFTVAGGPTAAAPDTGAGAGAGTVNVGGVQLPRTGSDEVVPLTLLGLGLLGTGAGMIVVARRRRQTGSTIA